VDAAGSRLLLQQGERFPVQAQPGMPCCTRIAAAGALATFSATFRIHSGFSCSQTRCTASIAALLVLGCCCCCHVSVLLLEPTSSSLYMPNRIHATSRVVTSFWRGLVAAMVASLRVRHSRCELWQHAHAAFPKTAHCSTPRRRGWCLRLDVITKKLRDTVQHV
jgi:hypothetical protein